VYIILSTCHRASPHIRVAVKTTRPRDLTRMVLYIHVYDPKLHLRCCEGTRARAEGVPRWSLCTLIGSLRTTYALSYCSFVVGLSPQQRRHLCPIFDLLLSYFVLSFPIISWHFLLIHYMPKPFNKRSSASSHPIAHLNTLLMSQLRPPDQIFDVRIDRPTGTHYIT
jgi:hypothetical protein